MKKIGIDARFCTDYSTGIGRHVEELIRHLALIDKTTVYTCFMTPEVAKNFKVPAKNFTIEVTDSPHYSLKEQFSFCRQISRHKFDLMVFPQFNLPVLYRGKYVVTIHDLTLHFFPGKKKTDWLSRTAYKFIINRAVKKASHILAVSKNTKKDLVEVLGVDPQKITVAYNGVSRIFTPITDLSIKETFRQKYRLPKKYFLYTGVLRTHKNILGLIEAYAEFLKHYPKTDIDLVLTGPKDHIYWPTVEQRIKTLKITSQVHHLGLVPHEAMNALFGSSWAYIFPSFYEGFGIPPIEAMMCHIPVACSKTASLPEACGEAAYYFDPYDQKAILKALEAVAFDQDLRSELIKKGEKQCQKFSWEKMTQQMYDIYQKILRK